MSSRQEEKERRKQERLEREQAAEAAAKRKRLIQLAGGAIVGVAVIVGVVIALGGGGTDKKKGPESPGSETGAPIPAQKETDAAKAASAAGCRAKDFPEEGNGHVQTTLTPMNYKTNPPTSGDHSPTPAQDGVYDPGNSPAIGSWIHTLEHGRIILMYKPGTPQRRVDQLRTLLNEPVAGGPEGYHMLLMENNTMMPFQVAAVAWRHYVGCPQFTDRSFDALRTFRDRFVDKGPEAVP